MTPASEAVSLLKRLSSALVHAMWSFAVAMSCSMAQANTEPRYYDFGFQAGTFLPSKIRGIRELIPGWGLRASTPTAKGIVEFSTYLGRGNGISYNSVSLDYRLDIAIVPELPAHFILGLHADYFTGKYSNTGRAMPSEFGSGWHYGGGISLPIAGPFLMRTDFKYRYGPGNALEITLGFGYRLPAEGF